ncbi:uncharacterized protein LOC141912680 isoform X2 [Tubulanus polymorphus]|uniref:uncharacterized protein LOC141912680 isoform X2 n=1 Tax=Tubulanus polymorphus TaxID=672921 RepID=UPI003DA4DD81
MALAQEYSVQNYSSLPTCIVNDVMERPQSALARGVQIRSFEDSHVNPEPITLEDTDILLEEYLSPRKLRALTGVDDLDQVKYLEMKVDTSETSLGNFGALLTNLVQLKVSNSIIASVRDLGSCLDNLKVLWMARCALQELDGLSSMYSLRELYLAYNEISDLSPISMLEHIKILDLEGNNVEEFSQVEFLAMVGSLTNLTLDGNPICVTPSPDRADPNYDYRQAVQKALPNLQVLDDEPFSTEIHQHSKAMSVFDADWALINELMDEGDLIDSRESIDVGNTPTNSRPGTANNRPFTSTRAPGGYRPGSALKQTAVKRPQTSLYAAAPSTAAGRPGSAFARPGSANRPTTARPGSGEAELNVDETSELTQGQVVCGNPSKALRGRRKRENPVAAAAAGGSNMFAQFKYKPEHSYDTENLDDENLKEIFNELKEWKKHNEIFKAQRERDRAPQVLRISDDESVSSSSGEEEEEDSDDEDVDELRSSVQIEQRRRLGMADEDVDGNNIQIDTGMKKPGISGNVRARRYRKPEPSLVDSSDNQQQQQRSAVISHSNDNIDSFNKLAIVDDGESRPISGPAAVKREKFRVVTESRDVLKRKPKEITKPVIKMSNQLRELIPPPNVPRASTARASMALPTPLRVIKQQQLSSISQMHPHPPK